MRKALMILIRDKAIQNMVFALFIGFLLTVMPMLFESEHVILKLAGVTINIGIALFVIDSFVVRLPRFRRQRYLKYWHKSQNGLYHCWIAANNRVLEVSELMTELYADMPNALYYKPVMLDNGRIIVYASLENLNEVDLNVYIEDTGVELDNAIW